RPASLLPPPALAVTILSRNPGLLFGSACLSDWPSMPPIGEAGGEKLYPFVNNNLAGGIDVSGMFLSGYYFLFGRPNDLTKRGMHQVACRTFKFIWQTEL